MANTIKCPNCGTDGFKNEKDYSCYACGYRHVDVKELAECQLTFCEGCGCTLSNSCTVHDASRQHPVKL